MGQAHPSSAAEECAQCRQPAADGAAIARALRAAGHQVTAARRAVVEAVAAQQRPFTAGQLCAAVAACDAGVGRATVFRTLELLEAGGIVDRLHTLPADPSYVVRPVGRSLRRRPAAPGAAAHHYLICTACDGVREVDDPRLAEVLEAMASRRAFRLERQVVELAGRCPAC